MRILIAIGSSALALSACGQRADDSAEPKSGNVAATTMGAAGANPLGKAVAGAQAKKIMHDRHEGMEDIGDAMKQVSGEVRKDSPDMTKIRSGTAVFAKYAPLVKGWYPPGTSRAAGKTRAKDEIWKKPDDFRAKAVAFEGAAAKLDAAAKGGDLAAIRAAHGDLGKTCKACHDPYREPEHD
jgi:cytochrome c556